MPGAAPSMGQLLFQTQSKPRETFSSSCHKDHLVVCLRCHSCFSYHDFSLPPFEAKLPPFYISFPFPQPVPWSTKCLCPQVRAAESRQPKSPSPGSSLDSVPSNREDDEEPRARSLPLAPVPKASLPERCQMQTWDKTH